MKNKYLFIIPLLATAMAKAQVGVNTTVPQAEMDIVSGTQGLLVPRIALTSVQTASPVINPNGTALANGTLI